MAARPTLRLALPTLALALLLRPDDAAAQHRHLCASVPSACSYTGPNAPKLDADVCFDAAAGVRLMSGGSCSEGALAYHVEFGEVVDPLTNEVAAYVPLNDACSQPGICVDGPPPPGPQALPICCIEGVCTHAIANCGEDGGVLYYCEDGVCNGDGTVTCFSAVPLDE